MDKLSNPFKDKAIRITQTTHNHLGGHSDFTMVRAIDCNPEPFDNRVYAEGDGVVIASVNSSNPNSYLHIRYDGMPSHILRELVHCRPSVAKGVRVKRGQLVGTLEPYRANWYGTGKPHSVHLHWSFLNTNKTGAPNPFNYLVRTTKVTTNATVIKNHRTWFNSNGTFNWSSFGDYKLDIKTPVPVDPCATEKKQIETLQAQIKGLNTKVSNLEKEVMNYENLETDYLKEIQELKNRITRELEAGEELRNQLAEQQKYVQDLVDMVSEKNKRIEELEGLLELAVQLENDLNKANSKIENLRIELNKKDNQILELKDKVAGGLEVLSLGDFITWLGIKLRGGIK